MSKDQTAVKETPARYPVSVVNAQGVPPGYKQTEVGVIPADWEVKPLGSVLNRCRLGGNYPNQDVETSSPLIKMGNIARSFIDTTKIQYIPSHVNPDVTDKLRYGDVLFNTRNTLELVGKVAIWRDGLPAAFYNSNLMRLEFDPNQVCSNDYANYALNSAAGVARLRALATGTTSVAAIYTRDLLEMLFVVPPVNEQRAIVAALSDVDALIAALDKLIAKKRAIKTAAMQQLLTGKQRLPGFGESTSYKQTEVGQSPEDWESTPLGKISTFITKGATPTTYGFGWERDGILFLRSECVSQDGLDLNQSMFISPEAHNVLRRSEVRSGDLLITITGNVGRVIYLRKDFVRGNINQHIARIRIKDPDVCTEFVFHFFSQSSTRKYYESITTGQAYPQISLRQVRDTIVPLPTLSEQRAIALALSDMDAEIAALEARRDKTKAIKQGMMQELLTGRTRLV